MARSFERTAIRVPGAPNVSGYVIKCSKCGQTDKVSANTHSGSMAPEGISNRFRNKGWLIGNRENSDICPVCIKESKKHKIQTSGVDNVVQLQKPTIVAEPPREMSKEDRRLIFAKVNEVYLDGKHGYSSGWSDKKVAIDLGVPQAWVRIIREENCGAEGENEDFKEILVESQKLLKDISVFEKIITERIIEAQKSKDELSARANHIAGRISQLEKSFK